MNNGMRVSTNGEPNTLLVVGGKVSYVNPDGVAIPIGQVPFAMGTVPLVAGTKAINIPGITAAANFAVLQLVTPNTATSTVDYQAVITNNTLTITALLAAKTINAADVSTLTYIVW